MESDITRVDEVRKVIYVSCNRCSQRLPGPPGASGFRGRGLSLSGPGFYIRLFYHLPYILTHNPQSEALHRGDLSFRHGMEGRCACPCGWNLGCGKLGGKVAGCASLPLLRTALLCLSEDGQLLELSICRAGNRASRVAEPAKLLEAGACDDLARDNHRDAGRIRTEQIG